MDAVKEEVKLGRKVIGCGGEDCSLEEERKIEDFFSEFSVALYRRRHCLLSKVVNPLSCLLLHQHKGVLSLVSAAVKKTKADDTFSV